MQKARWASRTACFVNYAPRRESVRNIGSEVEGKVRNGQTERVVVNIADTPVSGEQIREQLRTYPISGLKEVIVIDKQGRISHVYP
jgi:Contact-dependent growth inhibition CdiA C-terminal domain